jgi:hypothetical protein
MATAAEIRQKAAKKLGLVGEGQTLRAAITADLDEAYVEVYATLAMKSLATWAFASEVPDHLVNPVVWWVAGVRMDEYAIPNDRYQRVKSDYARAESEIRKLNADSRLGETEIENF